ncbi:hypothetical protein ACS0TY_000769 [Phlomoides rotata]
MSRHAQLPPRPRCPLQKKSVAPVANLSVSPPSGQYGHFRSFSQSSILEEQPPWLNDLLSDSDSSSNGTSLRRTASDPSTFIDGLDQLNEKETGDSCEEEDGVGSTCTYGPNSPRRKSKIGFPENEIVSAFSEYVIQSPLQYRDGCNEQASADQISSENKPDKRHPGQRSRARKLQYIAELEKTVDALQNLGSELGVRVASLIKQYTALLMENNTLKQHLMRMNQEKIIVDGEYQSLKKEVERLRTGFDVSTNKNHPKSYSAANFSRSDGIWDMIDMRRLDLN